MTMLLCTEKFSLAGGSKIAIASNKQNNRDGRVKSLICWLELERYLSMYIF
jgi:hypothetical protein